MSTLPCKTCCLNNSVVSMASTLLMPMKHRRLLKETHLEYSGRLKSKIAPSARADQRWQAWEAKRYRRSRPEDRSEPPFAVLFSSWRPRGSSP